jgi:serine/threonine-protein kinase
MPIVPPSQRNPDLPEALDEIVMTALARDPDRRWQSATALRAALTTVSKDLDLVVMNHEIVTWVEAAFVELGPLRRDTARDSRTMNERPSRTPRIETDWPILTVEPVEPVEASNPPRVTQRTPAAPMPIGRPPGKATPPSGTPPLTEPVRPDATDSSSESAAITRPSTAAATRPGSAAITRPGVERKGRIATIVAIVILVVVAGTVGAIYHWT